MKTILFSLLVLLSSGVHAQSPYAVFIGAADSLMSARQFGEAAKMYSNAFEANYWRGHLDDRIHAACCWAMIGNADSAFFQLERVTSKLSFDNDHFLLTEKYLESLHQDSRWGPLLENVKANRLKQEANWNRNFVHELDLIQIDDQAGRLALDSIERKYGRDSEQVKAQWAQIEYCDSINLCKITRFLDTHGWLGPDSISANGNMTLFLVIQHAPLETQEKYLPMMRQAMMNGWAWPGNLALLEDRVALGQGKLQVYGSQIGRHPETGTFYVLPLEDPDHVDERRASVMLGPLGEYVSYWEITWDVEVYKKELPGLIELEKMKK